MRRTSFLLALIMVLCIASIVGRADAEPTAEEKDKAAELVFKGDEHREKGDHERALKSYEKADEIMDVPSTGIEVAKTLVALGRWIEALEKAEEVAEYIKRDGEPEAFDRARDEAAKMASELGPQIPTLEIRLKNVPIGERIEGTINGKPLSMNDVNKPIQRDPGHYEVVVRAGHVTRRRKVELPAGKTSRVVIDLSVEDNWGPDVNVVDDASTPKRRSTPAMIGGFVLIGAGVLAHIGSAIFLGFHFNEAEELAAKNGNFAWLSFVGGTAMLAAGIPVLVVGMEEVQDDASAMMPDEVIIGAGSVAVTWRF